MSRTIASAVALCCAACVSPQPAVQTPVQTAVQTPVQAPTQTAVPAQATAPAAHNAAFITRLGNDTLYVERFSFAGGAYNVEQVLHSPVAALMHTHVGLTPSGGIGDVIYMHHQIKEPSAPLIASTRLTFGASDSARVVIRRGDDTTTRSITASASMVPSLPDSWLGYELAARRLLAARADTATMQFLEPDGDHTRILVRRIAADSIAFELPFTVYRARVDAEGRIMNLYQPNGLRVERVPAIDINAIAARWDELERQGKGMGMLSPRDSANVTVGAATISVNYSRPGMRGRTIWGGLVPWNQVWRTGANNPTQLRTTRDITIGGTSIPAGTYTLTSISTPDATKLIIGRGAGNDATEVARIDLAVSQLPAPVEKFTIAVEPGQGNRAILALSWDRRRMTAPIVVR